MNCPSCSHQNPKSANFCCKCGLEMKKETTTKRSQHKVAPNVYYGSYLLKGGWITVIVGILGGIGIFSQAKDSLYGETDGSVVLYGFLVIFLSIVYAWLYFGLHKVILKITRIEQALGIEENVQEETKKEEPKTNQPVSSSLKRDKNQDDLPWELKEE